MLFLLASAHFSRCLIESFIFLSFSFIIILRFGLGDRPGRNIWGLDLKPRIQSQKIPKSEIMDASTFITDFSSEPSVLKLEKQTRALLIKVCEKFEIELPKRYVRKSELVDTIIDFCIDEGILKLERYPQIS